MTFVFSPPSPSVDAPSTTLSASDVAYLLHNLGWAYERFDLSTYVAMRVLDIMRAPPQSPRATA